MKLGCRGASSMAIGLVVDVDGPRQ